MVFGPGYVIMGKSAYWESLMTGIQVLRACVKLGSVRADLKPQKACGKMGGGDRSVPQSSPASVRGQHLELSPESFDLYIHAVAHRHPHTQNTQTYTW